MTLFGLSHSCCAASRRAGKKICAANGASANRLSTETGIDHAFDMEPSSKSGFALDVYRFGRTSADLARWIDHSDDPHDPDASSVAWQNESSRNSMPRNRPWHKRPTREFAASGCIFADIEIIALAAQHVHQRPGNATRLSDLLPPRMWAELLKLR